MNRIGDSLQKSWTVWTIKQCEKSFLKITPTASACSTSIFYTFWVSWRPLLDRLPPIGYRIAWKLLPTMSPTQFIPPTQRNSTTFVVRERWNYTTCRMQDVTRISCRWQTARRAASRQTANAMTQRMLNIPHRMVIKPFLLLGLAAEYRSQRCMWLTLPLTIRSLRHSPANYKLTAPETISRSRDMIVPAKI